MIISKSKNASCHLKSSIILNPGWKILFQINGQEAEIIGEYCNEFGIKVLKFSQPHGPIYHYLEPTNTTFGDQPLLRDPLAKKYISVKNSLEFPEAGDGVFASRDIEPYTVFVQYAGIIFDETQNKIHQSKIDKIQTQNNWTVDDPRSVELWKYRFVIFIHCTTVWLKTRPLWRPLMLIVLGPL